MLKNSTNIFFFRNPYETLSLFPPTSNNVLRPVARRPTWTASNPADQPHIHHQHNNFEFPVKNPIPFSS